MDTFEDYITYKEYYDKLAEDLKNKANEIENNAEEHSELL